jgi:hypothetical protein
MHMLRSLRILLATASPAAPAAVAQAQGAASAPAADSVPAAADTATPVAQADVPVPLGLQLSGYVTASFTQGNHDVGNTIVGRFYDRFDDFMANAAKVVLERPVDVSKFDAGFRVDGLLGQNAAVTKAAGLSLGDQGDLPQLFATLNVPTGEGTYIQFKAGKMATLLGIEVMEDVANPNLSVANQFVYLENFTNTGVGMDLKLSSAVDAQLRVFNGWDLVTDNNSKKSFMGRIGFTPVASTTIGVLGYFGAEQSENDADDRYGAQLTVAHHFGTRLTLFLQGDYGEEQFGVAKANWYGSGAWLLYDATPKLGIALRADYIRDDDGARTSSVFGFPANSGQRFGSGTLTLNLKSWDKVLLRPELRYDRSDLGVFDGNNDQVSLGLGLSYLF